MLRSLNGQLKSIYLNKVAELLPLNGRPLSTISLWLLIAIIAKDGFLYSMCLTKDPVSTLAYENLSGSCFLEKIRLLSKLK